MSLQAQSEELRRLVERSQSLRRRIAAKERRLRDLSRQRTLVRNQTVGAVVTELAAAGKLSEAVIDLIKRELFDAVAGDNKKFGALQDSPFDLTNLLHELSEPVGE